MEKKPTDIQDTYVIRWTRKVNGENETNYFEAPHWTGDPLRATHYGTLTAAKRAFRAHRFGQRYSGVFGIERLLTIVASALAYRLPQARATIVNPKEQS